MPKEVGCKEHLLTIPKPCLLAGNQEHPIFMVEKCWKKKYERNGQPDTATGKPYTRLNRKAGGRCRTSSMLPASRSKITTARPQVTTEEVIDKFRFKQWHRVRRLIQEGHCQEWLTKKSTCETFDRESPLKLRWLPGGCTCCNPRKQWVKDFYHCWNRFLIPPNFELAPSYVRSWDWNSCKTKCCFNQAFYQFYMLEW